MEFLCAQDDYPYQIKRLTVRLFYPSAGKHKASGTCFLYYLSVYVSLSKIALFSVPPPGFERKRMQRYDYFPNYQNFLKKIFTFRARKCIILTNINDRILLHLIYYI